MVMTTMGLSVALSGRFSGGTSHTPLLLQKIGVAEDVQSGKLKVSQTEDYDDDGDGVHVDGWL